MSQAGVERIRQLMRIHSIVQGVLMALLLFVAWKLQQFYAGKGALKIFFNSIYLTLGLQVLFFYPIYRFAAKEASGELTAKAKKEQEQKALQRQRIVASLSKAAVFIFYGTMIASAPAGSFVSSTAFFSFFATTLTYLQCFNFAANKLLLAPKRR